VYDEIENHEFLIVNKSGMEPDRVAQFVDILFQHIEVVPAEDFYPAIERSDAAIGDIDRDDVLYLACAIACNAAIWSDDSDFEEQTIVETYSTGDVIDSADEVDHVITLLAEFPAEPAADRSGDGVDVLLDLDRVRQARENMGRGGIGAETTVLFVSHTHLGYENREITGRGDTVSWVREISSEEMFKRITQIAMEQDMDAVIHTGDILDHEVDRATLDATETFLAVLSGLSIPVYCIIGSHDHDSANPQHPDSVDGVAWLKSQVREVHLTELSTSPTPVADGPVDAYGYLLGTWGSMMSGSSTRASGHRPILSSGQRRPVRMCCVCTMG
jgi:hypothetical protein